MGGRTGSRVLRTVSLVGTVILSVGSFVSAMAIGPSNSTGDAFPEDSFSKANNALSPHGLTAALVIPLAQNTSAVPAEVLSPDEDSATINTCNEFTATITEVGDPSGETIHVTITQHDADTVQDTSIAFCDPDSGSAGTDAGGDRDLDDNPAPSDGLSPTSTPAAGLESGATATGTGTTNEEGEFSFGVTSNEAGTMTVVATVSGLAAEDTSTMTWTSEVARPDIEVTAANARLTDDGVRVKAKVSNVGTAPAPSTMAKAEAPDWDPGSSEIDSLPPGKSQRVVIILEELPQKAAGETYTFTVTVDSVPDENNISNNSSETNRLKVPEGTNPPACATTAPNTCPDLRVVSARAEALDDSVIIRVVIENVGSARTRATRVAADSPDWGTQSMPLRALLGGEKARVDIGYPRVPTTARGRRYSFAVTIEPVPRERNLQNNTLETNPIVLGGQPPSSRLPWKWTAVLISVAAIAVLLFLIVLAATVVRAVRTTHQRRWVLRYLRLEPFADASDVYVNESPGETLPLGLRLESHIDPGKQTIEERVI